MSQRGQHQPTAAGGEMGLVLTHLLKFQEKVAGSPMAGMQDHTLGAVWLRPALQWDAGRMV